jgi:hypothetical protein
MSDDPKIPKPEDTDETPAEKIDVTVHPTETVSVPAAEEEATPPEDPGEHLPNPAERRKLDQAPENR